MNEYLYNLKFKYTFVTAIFSILDIFKPVIINIIKIFIIIKYELITPIYINLILHTNNIKSFFISLFIIVLKIIINKINN